MVSINNSIDETVYYKSPLGPLCIKCNGHLITAVLYLNTANKALIPEDELSYSRGNSSITEKCIQQLDEYFKGARLQFDLEFAQTGTEFQQVVWAELLKINYGRTLSYLSLSKRIGNVKAIRAAASANGKNKINIIVPCHRVIGSNGNLVGYGGDLWRKKWLLEHEARYGNAVQALFS